MKKRKLLKKALLMMASGALMSVGGTALAAQDVNLSLCFLQAS